MTSNYLHIYIRVVVYVCYCYLHVTYSNILMMYANMYMCALYIAVPTENNCQNCFDTAHIEVMMMRITINLSAASIPGLPPEMDICVCCDSALGDMHITPLKRKTQAHPVATTATAGTMGRPGYAAHGAAAGGRGGGGHLNAGYRNNSSSSNANTMRHQPAWNPTTPGMPTTTHLPPPTANLGTICSLLYTCAV